MLTEPLLERLEEKEKDVEVIRVKKIDLSEHCDLYVLRPPPPPFGHLADLLRFADVWTLLSGCSYWAAEAVEWCYYDIVEDIERTRPLHPSSDVVEDGAGLGLEL